MKRKNKTKTETASSGPVYGGDFDFDTIHMIALDLDGTTLTRSGLTRRTKETLEEAIRRGIQVVIATGRVYASLPEPVKSCRGCGTSSPPTARIFRMRRPERFFTPIAWTRRQWTKS